MVKEERRRINFQNTQNAIQRRIRKLRDIGYYVAEKEDVYSDCNREYKQKPIVPSNRSLTLCTKLLWQ